MLLVFCAGSLLEKPGEQICPAAKDCGGGQETCKWVRTVQNGQEEEEEKLFGCHAQAPADRGWDEPVQSQEGKEAHTAGLSDHRRYGAGWSVLLGYHLAVFSVNLELFFSLSPDELIRSDCSSLSSLPLDDGEWNDAHSGALKSVGLL